jgi:hypothetical protein
MPILNINLNNSAEEEVRKSINYLLKDTCDQCQQIEDLLKDGPEILRAYYNFRNILRQVKRGDTFKKAINEHALTCCPPNFCATLECEEKTCSQCWKEYCLDYLEAINAAKENK